MLCNRLVSKKISLSLTVLLFFSFWLGVIPDAQAKGVCIKEDYNGVLQCEMKLGEIVIVFLVFWASVSSPRAIIQV